MAFRLLFELGLGWVLTVKCREMYLSLRVLTMIVQVCLCVCVFLHLLHSKHQNMLYTMRTFELARLRFKIGYTVGHGLRLDVALCSRESSQK